MTEPHADRVPATSHIGKVTLRVSDLEREVDFYHRVLGLRRLATRAASVEFSASGEAPALLRLVEDVHAPIRPSRASGLFHFALLVPRRADLARALLHVRDSGWPFSGLADHTVSEAIYLSDPEGNGIEIYADRPRSQWTWVSGEVVMTTDPLNVEDLVATISPGERWNGLAIGAEMGHIHLEVTDLDAAEKFYAGRLGLETTLRSYPGGRFLSAGGYHHHLAVNVWNRRRAPAEPGARGLASFELVVPGLDARSALARRLGARESAKEGGLASELKAKDPFGIEVVVAG